MRVGLGLKQYIWMSFLFFTLASVFDCSIFGCCFHFGSTTQAVHALSSGEAELYGIGTAVAEALHIRSFLEELKVFKTIKVYVYTD